MPFLCRTTVGPWTSYLISDTPGSDEVFDGEIIVDAEGAGGTFTGQHIADPITARATQTPINGTCARGSSAACSDRRCHIVMSRTFQDGGQTFTFTYESDFIRVRARHRTEGGRYRIRRTGREAIERGDKALAEDDGTWNGEKPIT